MPSCIFIFASMQIKRGKNDRKKCYSKKTGRRPASAA